MPELVVGVGLTWVDDAVLIVVVGQVHVGGAAAPGKLQHHHPGRTDALPQIHHIRCDDTQILCNHRHIPQLLQAAMHALCQCISGPHGNLIISLICRKANTSFDQCSSWHGDFLWNLSISLD